jgi:hypothetical protein
MQEEREDKVDETDDVEGHRYPRPSPEEAAGRTDESDDDEVEAHRWPHQGPEEFGKRF